MSTIKNDNLSGWNEGEIFPNLPLKYLTASSIIGDKVRNKKDEHLGAIKDIMLDISTGKIDYFVIEFGGFLGIGIKYFAIPFRLLKVDPEKKAFIFDQSKDALEKAPGFDIDHWPDTNLHLDQVYSYWSFF
ncbi:MAG: PRC-barrel domain-containing protein [Chitinophagales bacterium]